MGDGFYRSEDPTNSIKVLKDHTNSTQITQKYNEHTYKHKTANPLVCTNMGWLGDGSHRGQGHQAWTAVGLPQRYPRLNRQLKTRVHCRAVMTATPVPSTLNKRSTEAHVAGWPDGTMPVVMLLDCLVWQVPWGTSWPRHWWPTEAVMHDLMRRCEFRTCAALHIKWFCTKLLKLTAVRDRPHSYPNHFGPNQISKGNKLNQISNHKRSNRIFWGPESNHNMPQVVI